MLKEFINSHYYLISVVIILISIVAFFFGYEKRKPHVREIVTLAVMSASAVVARAAFIMLPHFKPMTAIIMITGMGFGPFAGFLTGVISAFVSNFIFGQGPWTPWQMIAYGIAGVLAGLLRIPGIMHEKKRIRTAVIGFVIVVAIIGPILDTYTFLTVSTMITQESVSAIYLSGLPLNIVHGVATFITLLLVCKPIIEKLTRIKIKYGMLSEGKNEI